MSLSLFDADVAVSGALPANGRIGGQVRAGQFGLPDVQVSLLDDMGVILETTRTNDRGVYEFSGLESGIYSIKEHQPDAFCDGYAVAGSAGVKYRPVNHLIGVVLEDSDAITGYDFVDLPTTLLSGRVVVSSDGAAPRDNDAGINARSTLPRMTRINLYADPLHGLELVSTVDIDENGSFVFNEVCTESAYFIEPSFSNENNDTISLDQLTLVFDTTQSGVAVTTEFSKYGAALVWLGSTVDNSRQGDASISGRVSIGFVESVPLEGVTLSLFDDSGSFLGKTWTNTEGVYRFSGIASGVYSIVSNGHSMYCNWYSSAGSAGGVSYSSRNIGRISLAEGNVGTDYDFFVLPPPTPISGRVMSGDNGISDSGKIIETSGYSGLSDYSLPVAEVEVQLWKKSYADPSSGFVYAAAARTDSHGRFVFYPECNVDEYAVRIVEPEWLRSHYPGFTLRLVFGRYEIDVGLDTLPGWGGDGSAWIRLPALRPPPGAVSSQTPTSNSPSPDSPAHSEASLTDSSYKHLWAVTLWPRSPFPYLIALVNDELSPYTHLRMSKTSQLSLFVRSLLFQLASPSRFSLFEFRSHNGAVLSQDDGIDDDLQNHEGDDAELSDSQAENGDFDGLARRRNSRINNRGERHEAGEKDEIQSPDSHPLSNHSEVPGLQHDADYSNGANCPCEDEKRGQPTDSHDTNAAPTPGEHIVVVVPEKPAPVKSRSSTASLDRAGGWESFRQRSELVPVDPRATE